MTPHRALYIHHNSGEEPTEGKSACACARVRRAHTRTVLIRARARASPARQSLHCPHPTRVLPLSRCPRSGLQRRRADAGCRNAAVAPGSKASTRVGDNTHGRALDGRSRRRSFRRPPRRPSLPDLHGSRPPATLTGAPRSGRTRSPVVGAVAAQPFHRSTPKGSGRARLPTKRLRGSGPTGRRPGGTRTQQPQGARGKPPPRSVAQRALAFLPPRARGSEAAARRALLRLPRRRAEGRETLLPRRRAGSYVVRTRGAHVRFRPAPTGVRVTSWPH